MRSTKSKPFLTIGLITLPAFLLVARCHAAEISGSVMDPGNHPVTPAHISVMDPADVVVSQVDADPHGRYSIRGLASGEYRISLVLAGTKYRGQTIWTGVPEQGLCVDWMVSQNAGALAVGRPGASTGSCNLPGEAAADDRGDVRPNRSSVGQPVPNASQRTPGAPQG